MTSKTLTTVLVTALMSPLSMPVWADDAASKSTADTVAHPVEAYHEHEVKSDAVDAKEYAQRKAEAKARLDQANADYEKSLQSSGPNSEVTKDAKKRLAEARKEYKKLAKKTTDAKQELQEDQQKLNQDKTAQ